jgi:ATP phosphoribosyltransferase regulatory subunit
MSRFEEYGLYAENKAFLASGDIITFTGAGGKLMALRPDVTLSIVKSAKDDDRLMKLYYNENVYRSDGHEFKERMQVGLECIGTIDVKLMGEVLMLARRSLEALGERTRLDISHMGFIGGLLQSAELSPAQRTELLKRFSEKNVPELSALCAEYGLDDLFCEKLAALATLYGPYDETVDALRRISVNADTEAALREMEDVFGVLRGLGAADDVNLDFSIVNDLSYYSGIIFQGYIEGIPTKVLSGGRYDELLRKFGKKAGAVGFAVYLDLLERLTPSGFEPGFASGVASGFEPDSDGRARTAGVADSNRSDRSAGIARTDESAGCGKSAVSAETAKQDLINIALPKGRLGEKAYAIFESAGYGCPAIHEESRKLVFESPENRVRYFWVKPSDVAIYVERGAADIGVAGKDILLEYSPDIYELLDLGIGKCRMCVAAEKGFDFAGFGDRTLRVATKFPNIARDYYEKVDREIDIIKLNGSIELAPILGLSDVIVDIVETGGTLLENNLEPVETIVDISARLVSNKASYKFKHGAISDLCGRISETLSD